MNNGKKQVMFDDLFPLVSEQLSHGGSFTFRPNGVSMLPLIRQGTDGVVIEKQLSPLKRYDIPLYQRDDKSFVIHRVIKACPDGTYIMCGDNQTELEYGISESQIIGVVTGIYRGEKFIPVSSPILKIYNRFTVLRRHFRKSFFRRAIRWGLRKCKLIKSKIRTH